MKLSDLFEDVNAYDVKRIEAALNRFTYQPEDKIKNKKPVLDVELPTKSAHFFQRLNQRADKANIDLGQIYNLLKNAKADPQMGFARTLDILSRMDDPDATVTIQDDKGLTVPVIVHANPECDITTDGIPVCKTKDGDLLPRNTMTAKTVFRKGVDD